MCVHVIVTAVCVVRSMLCMPSRAEAIAGRSRGDASSGTDDERGHECDQRLMDWFWTKWCTVPLKGQLASQVIAATMRCIDEAEPQCGGSCLVAIVLQQCG